MRATIGVGIVLMSAALFAASAPAAPILAFSDNAVVRVDDTTRDVTLALKPRVQGGRLGSFALSRDGSEIAYVWSSDSFSSNEPTQLRIAPLDGSSESTIFKGELASPPSWSPDGARVLFGRARRVDDAYHVDTWEIPRAGGSARRLVSDAMDAAYSPDGSQLAYVKFTIDSNSLKSTVIVRDMLTGATRSIGDGHEPAWAPNGARLAYVSWRDRNGLDCRGESCIPATELYVADLATGVERRVTTTKSTETDPTWSPDGRRVAVGADRPTRGTESEIWTYSSDGGCPVQLTWMGPWIGAPIYEPAAGSDTAGAACGTHPATYTAPDVQRAGPSMLYPGIRYRGGLLSDVDRGFLNYAECAVPARTCPPELQLQAWSICKRYPSHYGSPGHPFTPSHVWKRRGAIIAAWPTSGGFDVYTGSTTLAVFGVPARSARAFVDKLRTVTRSDTSGNLPAPRFTAKDLGVIRRAPELREIATRLPSRVNKPTCSAVRDPP